MNCPKCDNKYIVKHGTRKTLRKGLVQKYQCKNCGYKFSNPNGWRMGNDPEYIFYALKLHSKGLSLRGIVEALQKKYKVKIAHTSVMNWIKEFYIGEEEKEEFKFTIEGKDLSVSFKTQAEREDILSLINKLVKKPTILKKR